MKMRCSLKNSLKSKKFLIFTILLILVLGIYLIYDFIINPKDEFGNRCQILYNQSQYELFTKDIIDISKKSCFVSECCSHAAIFRSKKDYNELKEELEELEKKLNFAYPKLKFEISVEHHSFYNSYIIKYF